MPYALIVIGLVMIVTGVMNTYVALADQLRKDFTGPGNFVVWLLALGSIGALGYINNLRQFSHYFMALVLISMILANKGFFGKLQDAFASGPIAPTASALPTVAPSSSTRTIDDAIRGNQTGLFGSTPTTEGQAKAFGWLNWFFGTGTSTTK